MNIRTWAIPVLAASLVLAAPPTVRADPLGLLPGYDDPQSAFPWQGQ